MKVLIYRRIDENTEKRINQFLKKENNQSIFQSPYFFKVCIATEKMVPFYFVLYEKNNIKACMLAIIQYQFENPILKYFSSRSVIWGSPIVENKQSKYFSALFEEYNSIIRKKVLYTQIRNLTDMQTYKSFFENQHFSFEEHLNIHIDLKKTKDELWKDISSKRRNEVRRAIKEGTTFEMINTEDSLVLCYDILNEVYTRARLPLPSLNHFKALLKQANNNLGLRIGTAYFEGNIIGCMLVLVYNETIYDYYAGSYSAFYKKYPNDLIPWEIFKWGKKNGYSRFDFGGAGKPNEPYGVRNYKKKFGGEFVNFGRFVKVHNQFIYNIAEKSFLLMQKIKY